MKNLAFLCVLPFIFLSCGDDEKLIEQKEAQKAKQWLNPIFFANDFENELNFPLWFNRDLVLEHQIYKITKRVYGRMDGDSSLVNDIKLAIPKEKTEFYFDPNGFVDQLVIYSYFDDREIARANFIYEGNMMNSGYRKVRSLPLISLSKSPLKDEFTTEFFQDKTHQYNFLSFLFAKKKYTIYTDLEKGTQVFEVRNKINWGPLSIDSIIHPKKDDWVILGTMRKPHKRYHVENIVKESSIYSYQYWKSGVLKSMTKKIYPFVYKRSYLYDKNNIWNGYIDSTFSENGFISRIVTDVFFDEFQRPIELIHKKYNGENESYSFRETLHYRTKNKQYESK